MDFQRKGQNQRTTAAGSGFLKRNESQSSSYFKSLIIELVKNHQRFYRQLSVSVVFSIFWRTVVMY